MKLLTILLLLGFASASSEKQVVRLTEDNFVVLRGPVTAESASKVITKLMNNHERHVVLYINTNGGSVVSGMQIVQAMEALTNNGKNITCVANVALSMGFVIFQYCQQRFVLESTITMQHQMALGVEGQLYNIKSYMDFISGMSEDIDDHQAFRVGLTRKEFEDKIRHDWWLFGKANLREKVGDEMVSVLCDFKHAVDIEVFQTVFGEVRVHFPKCPLASYPVKIEFDRIFVPNFDEIKRNITIKYNDMFDMYSYIRNRLAGNTVQPLMI